MVCLLDAQAESKATHLPCADIPDLLSRKTNALLPGLPEFHPSTKAPGKPWEGQSLQSTKSGAALVPAGGSGRWVIIWGEMSLLQMVHMKVPSRRTGEYSWGLQAKYHVSGVRPDHSP